ncbi:MAG: hypothetical protein K2J11_06840 [Oscillospiraceae bacterium]|nr:hypothetical protein [Oscillospiraceae bacterium]
MAEVLKEPFLRPNINNKGTLPDGKESTCECPDIWCAGDTPIFDFQKKLADDYDKASDTQYVRGHDNYFYLRMKNGSEKEIKDMSAKLYYAKASVINWPSEWKSVPVENQDEGDTVNSFGTVAAGAVGVVKAPFILERDLAVDENYCFIAQIYSDYYPNLKPAGDSPLYVSSLLKQHLLWGQQNMAAVSAGNVPQVDITLHITFPAELTATGNLWLLSLHTENADKLDVEIRNSRTDDEGKEIKLERQRANENMPIAGRFVLNKGYNSQVSLYVYLPDGYVVTGNERFRLDMGYIVNNEERERAQRMGLISSEYDLDFLGSDESVINVGKYVMCLKP